MLRDEPADDMVVVIRATPLTIDTTIRVDSRGQLTLDPRNSLNAMNELAPW